jgi:tryptophan 2,3-dioxygenase
MEDFTNMEIRKATHYKDYLKLNDLLSSQKLLSYENGKNCHDEMLFIITHQVYELWFKQILHELYSVRKIFKTDFLHEGSLASAVSSLNRIEKIQGILIAQLDVMETMTPMDFLEFRDLLVPASGFQSAQFREIEILLGLKLSTRLSGHSDLIVGQLDESDRKKLLQEEQEELLPELIERWLERLPFTENERYVFWEEYQKAIFEMTEEERTQVQKNIFLTESEKLSQLKSLEENENRFKALFDEDLYKKARENSYAGLSRKAYLNALFILLYRQEGVLILPFQLLTCLSNIDENFSRWRYRHALMAKRMLGDKMGTGGSSGHKYLSKTVENNRIFQDLVSLPSYLIPSSRLPKLPLFLTENMNFKKVASACLS